MSDSRPPIVDPPAPVARLEARIRELEADLARRTDGADGRAAAAADEHVRRLEAVAALAGGVAHDFNNLLTSVLGNADLALAHLPPSSPARPHLKHIEHAARRAAELTRQMLACSGRGQLLVRPVDFGALVRGKLPVSRALCPPWVTLETVIADDLPLIDADADQIGQVLMHLVTNAAEAIGDRAGRLRIVVGACVCTRAELAGSYLGEALPEGRYVSLEVSDTGAGMPPEIVARMFEPFFTTKFTGRGLGLAAALGILRGHRGAVRVASEPGRGTTIHLLLPAQPTRPEVATMSSSYPSPGSAARMTPAGTAPSTGTPAEAPRTEGTAGAPPQDGLQGASPGSREAASLQGTSTSPQDTPPQDTPPQDTPPRGASLSGASPGLDAGVGDPARAAGMQTAGARGARGVLVIDDEETVRGVAKTILERAGYSVFTAANGPDGVRRFEAMADEIGLVLLDMKLPIMTSRQVSEALLRLRPDVRIVLSSGYLEEDAWPASPDEPNPYAGFLAKPYRFDELIACVQQVMAGEPWSGGM